MPRSAGDVLSVDGTLIATLVLCFSQPAQQPASSRGSSNHAKANRQFEQDSLEHMRALLNSAAVLMLGSLAAAQTSVVGEARLELPPACAQNDAGSVDAILLGMLPSAFAPGTPAAALQSGHIPQLKKMATKGFNQAIMSENSPALESWRPLTAREKFQTFLSSSYSPGIYAGAGMDAATQKFIAAPRGYLPGWEGFGQHYGVMLANSEADVFFKSFLFPTLLRQDPRYYRNPSLSFFERVGYATTRVLIARADHGGPIFNGSLLLGSAARQALKNAFVPGERQGIGAVGTRVAWDLLRESGSNLMHEFWPDLRRRFFHR
jgi:hypothetical protein